MEVRILANSTSAIPADVAYQIWLKRESGHTVIIGPAAYEAVRNDQEEAIRNLPGPGGPRKKGQLVHGHPSNYSRKKCTCWKCKDAWHAYNTRRYRAQKQTK
jgi:hypothetical protein